MSHAMPRVRQPANGPPGDMVDGFGRRIEYLRISVTDKCNLRCVYCMPEEGLPWLRRGEILTYEEIAEIVGVMADMGLRRLRLTGGEPLVRKDLPRLVDLLAAVRGIEDIALSTNAVLLAPVAKRLRDAGVSRVNISLDSLRPERADAIARRPGTLARVMEGLDAAHAVGFDPIKINVVLMRGENDDEIPDFAELSRDRPLHVRFIEVMPTESNLELSASNFLSCDEALARVGEVAALEPVPGPPRQRPGDVLQLPPRPGHHRGDHADEPQLLQPLQPHATHRRRPVAPLSVRHHPDPAPGRLEAWRCAGAPHQRNTPHQARETPAGPRLVGGVGRSDRPFADGRMKPVPRTVVAGRPGNRPLSHLHRWRSRRWPERSP